MSARQLRARVSTRWATQAEARASRKDTPTMPTHGSSGATGVSTTAKASRPHGIPLKGQPLRTTSAVVQAAAPHTGHHRRVGA